MKVAELRELLVKAEEVIAWQSRLLWALGIVLAFAIGWLAYEVFDYFRDARDNAEQELADVLVDRVGSWRV